ncbi:MAG: rRNA maturation RNase YbeY, partial [Rhodospirillales bacterium RIFCSPLOWO2_01_FULL_65_14]
TAKGQSRGNGQGTIKGAGRAAEASIVLADDAFVRRLNREYRHVDKPTNVLAFASLGAGAEPRLPARAPWPLGDVVIAYGTATREAKRLGRTLGDHLCHLVVHGMLHLMGHDHQTDRAAQAMEKREVAILAGLGVANPYGDGRPARAGK